jgi:hypothetical protein
MIAGRSIATATASVHLLIRLFSSLLFSSPLLGTETEGLVVVIAGSPIRRDLVLLSMRMTMIWM